MLEILSHEFMQNAFLAALLASIACGVIGALVVVNRLVFMAGGIAHAAYGGIGLAFYFGWPVFPSTIGFTLFSSVVMGKVTLHRKERSDTVVGVLWAAGMALGILLLDLSPGYNVDLMSYLFGSILTVPGSDVLIMLVLDVCLICLVLLFYKYFLAISFDQEFARARGIPVSVLYFTLLAMIAISVVMIIQVVGLILVIALLTIPSYMAQRQSASLGKMMLLATLWSLLFCVAGLWLAYVFNLTSGASIIALGTICFTIQLFYDWSKKRLRG
jgi:zinc transport system permease protein